MLVRRVDNDRELRRRRLQRRRVVRRRRCCRCPRRRTVRRQRRRRRRFCPRRRIPAESARLGLLLQQIEMRVPSRDRDPTRDATAATSLATTCGAILLLLLPGLPLIVAPQDGRDRLAGAESRAEVVTELLQRERQRIGPAPLTSRVLLLVSHRRVRDRRRCSGRSDPSGRGAVHGRLLRRLPSGLDLRLVRLRPLLSLSLRLRLSLRLLHLCLLRRVLHLLMSNRGSLRLRLRLDLLLLFRGGDLGRRRDSAFGDEVSRWRNERGEQRLSEDERVEASLLR